MISWPSTSHFLEPSDLATARGNGVDRRTSWVTPAGSTREARSYSALDRGLASDQRSLSERETGALKS